MMADQENSNDDITENNKSGSPQPSNRSKSAKSNTSHQRSVKTPGSGKSGKSPVPAKKGDKKKADKKRSETPATDVSEYLPVPEGTISIFLSAPTQQILNCVGDQDVTAEEPLKLISKEVILNDISKRAAVSEFKDHKKVIENIASDDILFKYDPEWKYGANFLLAVSDEARELLLNPPLEPGDEAEGGAEKEAEEEEVHGYIPPVAKPWVSLGSEFEIYDSQVKERSTRICMTVSRKRSEFGAPFKFSDRNVSDAKDGYAECESCEDKSFEVKLTEREQSIQVTPFKNDASSQTEWKYPVNAYTQYAPREIQETQKQELLISEELNNAVDRTTSRFSVALQHNEIMNCFYDDYINLAEGDNGFGNKADNTLKELQSFTDLVFSKDKAVTCVDWHPSLRGILFVSVAERISFDQRIDQSSRVIMSPSLILVWSFSDPIQPQLLLEAPDDIHSFQICPSDPHIVAGGCINGQIVLWDISEHMESLRNVKSRNKSKASLIFLPGFEDPSFNQVPRMRYCAVSQIAESVCHFAPITDIQWVPDHFEIARATGYALESKSLKNVQLLSAAADSSIFLWDIRHDKQAILKDKNKDAELPPPMGVPETFQFLNLKWRPSLLIHLSKSEPGGDHNPVCFSMKEVQGNRQVLYGEQDEIQGSKDHKKTIGGDFNYGNTKPGSGKAQRMLQNVNTYLYVGTEDGEIVYVDWMPQKDQDTGKSQTPKPVFYSSLHDGPISAIQRSPFNNDIILVIGGWMWSIWKEGINSGPIISSSSKNKPLTSGCWSTTRASVFFITRSDGAVDVWDLLDKTHEPVLSQGLSSTALTTVRIWKISSKQVLLVCGDMNGSLHVHEVPWRLRVPAPNETVAINAYLDREVKRRHFVLSRWHFREKEKMEHEAKLKREAGIAPVVVLSEDEIIGKMKMDYTMYLDEEQAFLRELGLKEDEDPLPKID